MFLLVKLVCKLDDNLSQVSVKQRRVILTKTRVSAAGPLISRGYHVVYSCPFRIPGFPSKQAM